MRRALDAAIEVEGSLRRISNAKDEVESVVASLENVRKQTSDLEKVVQAFNFLSGTLGFRISSKYLYGTQRFHATCLMAFFSSDSWLGT